MSIDFYSIVKSEKKCILNMIYSNIFNIKVLLYYIILEYIILISTMSFAPRTFVT